MWRYILLLDKMCPPQNRGNPTVDCMALIVKRVWFPTNINETRGGGYFTTSLCSRQAHWHKMGWTCPPCFFLCLFHLPYMKECILILKILVCIPKGDKYFTKEMERNLFIQTERVSYIHHWLCNWPSVIPFRYPNPTIHIKPTTNPSHELTKV